MPLRPGPNDHAQGRKSITSGRKGPISFGNEGSGRNLPFGVIVDNIGLNGLLLLDNQDEREIFITADGNTREQSRQFHLTTGAGGGQSSLPVTLMMTQPRHRGLDARTPLEIERHRPQEQSCRTTIATR